MSRLKHDNLLPSRHGRRLRLGKAVGWLLLATMTAGSDSGGPSSGNGPVLNPRRDPQTAAHAAVEDSAHGPAGTSVLDLRRLQREREQRLQGVRSQLEELARRQRAAPPLTIAVESTTGRTLHIEAASAPIPATTTPQPLTQDPHRQPLHAEPPAPASHHDTPVSAPPDPDIEHVHPEEGAPIDGAIDRVSLADSLYVLGDIATAEQVYQSVDVAELNQEQRAWIDFQLAGCERRTNRLAEAQKRYRQLVTASEPPWIAELARWWLNQLDDRTRLTSNAQRLSALLGKLETEVEHEIAIDPRLPIHPTTAGAEP